MKYRLMKDLIIPAGTIFENIDGLKREYVSGNVEYIAAVGNDATAHIVIGSVEDCKDWIALEPPKEEK